MPNGADKNFIRLCATIDGFRIRYNAWPTAVRLPAGMIADLRDDVLGPEAFAKVEAKLRLIPDDAVIVAEDGTGRAYKYEGKCFPDQELDIPARDWLGVEALEEVRYDRAMEAAIHLAAQPNYLGDPAVIDKVLTELWKTVFNRWKAGVAVADAGVKADSEACEAAARIVLGMDANFTAMPAWNRPDIIDSHAAEVMNIAEQDPVIRIAYLLLSYLNELWGVVAAMKKSGVGSDQYQQQGGGVALQKYRHILMGVIEPTLNKRDLATSLSPADSQHDAVYVLTNKAMPGMVKIGFTRQEDIQERVDELYTTGVPLAFQIEWACRTKNAAEAERALHKAFKHNRVNESREFFSIEPEQAIEILKLLNAENIMAEVAKQPTTIDQKSVAAEKKFGKRPNLDFVRIGIPIGSVLQSTKDAAFSATVVVSKKVKIGNEEMSLTEATRRALKLPSGYPIQPSPYWKFNGKLLHELYEKIYGVGNIGG